MSVGVGHKCIAAVKRCVQPFVPVVGPRIRELGASQQMPVLGACRHPQAKGSINVDPCSLLMCDRDQLVEGIKCTDVEVAGLEKHDGWLLRALCESARERNRIEATLRICRQCVDCARAKSQDPNSSFDRSVVLAARDQPNRRATCHALFLDVPSGSLEQSMASRRKARDVRHLRTGNECKACRPGQSEQVLEPFAGHFLDDRFGGSAGVNGRILIPRRRQPVGCKRSGQGAADDPAKKTPAGAADNPSLSVANQLIDDLDCDELVRDAEGGIVGSTSGRTNSSMTWTASMSSM